MNSRENAIKVATPHKLNDSLGFLVNGLARLMRTTLENRLKPTGLTPTTWTILMALGEEDPLNQTDLARRTFLDGATITRATDLLEAKGLLERNRDDNDRRVQIVGLTDAGRATCRQTARFGQEINADAVAELKPAERRHLIEYLDRSIQRMMTYAEREANNAI